MRRHSPVRPAEGKATIRTRVTVNSAERSCKSISNLKYWSLLVLTLSFLAGCNDPAPPERVFVPGPDASITITIAASTIETAVDEPVILYATRRTSGYVEKPYSQVPEGVQWWRQMPPGYEKEVAANLRWVVRPEGKSVFNTDFRKDFTREVRFSEPGTYELYGVSAGYGPEPVASEAVTITVE